MFEPGMGMQPERRAGASTAVSRVSNGASTIFVRNPLIADTDASGTVKLRSWSGLDGPNRRKRLRAPTRIDPFLFLASASR